MKSLFSFILLFTTLSVFTQQWQPVPLVSQEIKDNGHFGGEGCQWPLAIEVDQKDGSFLLFGTDVGGIYRSIDGGDSWEPCNVGYNPRGNCGFAIDPFNTQRALAVGGNSLQNFTHGIYLSTDQAGSWKHVLEEGDYEGYRDFKDKITFDPSSYDADSGYCMRAYWSNPAGGLYRSDDGGETWAMVHSQYGNSHVKVGGILGNVIIGTEDDILLSTDRGENFEVVLSGSVQGLSTIISDPDAVWASVSGKLMVSNDEGASFTEVATDNFPSNAISLDVSAANPLYMMLTNDEGEWVKPGYYSHDGGITWSKSSKTSENAFMPQNERGYLQTLHPTDENRAWAFGGDWITSTRDGGETFTWDANGYNAILVGGKFNFNLVDPSILYVASQDYNGAVTFDNGDTWKYCNASGLGWGGFTYGAYAASENVLVTQVSESWHEPGPITISRDGGVTFTKTSHICAGLETATGDAKDPDVIYFSNWRSDDLGESWTGMDDCDGVFIADIMGTKAVYGAKGADLVKSDDLGLTWQVLATLPAGIVDVAYDHTKDKLYAVTNNSQLFQLENGLLTDITDFILVDQFGNRRLKTVAVDPVDPRVVYVGGPRDVYASDASVQRSRDSGFTWEILTRNNRSGNEEFGNDGGREAVTMRVNPETGELWVAGGCYGIWKIAAPDSVPFSQPVIRLSHQSYVLSIYDTARLSIRATYEIDTTATWESSDPSVVEVTEGEIIGISQGTATVNCIIPAAEMTLTCIVTVKGTQAPFGDSPAAVPGRIEAENFDRGGETVGYHDSDIENSGNQYRTGEGVDIETCSQGGYNIGWTAVGEWLKYTIDIEESGAYDILLGVASQDNGGALELTFSEGDVQTGSIEFSATGGWQTWEEVRHNNIELFAGEQEMKLTILKEGFNLDYIEIIEHEEVGLLPEASSELRIYPNPSRGYITLSCPGTGFAEVEIHSLNGQLILNDVFESFPTHIDLLFQPKGIYFVTIRTDGWVKTEKVVRY